MVSKNFDTCASFHINNGAFYGRMVRLDEVINTILSKHQYTPVVSGILAESTALAALLSSTIKYDGLFTFQTQSNGPVSMVVVDVSSQGTIRASAKYDEARIERAKTLRKTEDEHEETPHFLGGGYMAFTVDQGGPDKMYQGVVDIQGKTLAECAMRYFKQSEQIDTYIRLFLQAPATPQSHWSAAGVLLQKLPSYGGKLDADVDINAAWEEAVVFIDSLKNEEVFDVITARAVASLSVLSEISVRSLKIGGKFVFMKANCDSELSTINRILSNLSLDIEEIKRFSLPVENSIRTLVCMKKKGHTIKKFPRSIDKIKRNPL